MVYLISGGYDTDGWGWMLYRYIIGAVSDVLPAFTFSLVIANLTYF